MSTVPVLETSRLVLRGHTRSDFADTSAMWADPIVARYVGGKPFTEEESWIKFLRNVGHWQILGFGYWVVREKVSGKFVGEVGFGDFKREISPSIRGTPEAGWVLASWSHGRGFATEAVRAVLDWGASHFGSSRSVCLIDPGNEASLRVAAKCGYREFARATYKSEPVILFER